MKFGFRTPSFKKSFKAKTTRKWKKQVKKSVIPGYGKKGVVYVKNPMKAVYNKVYNKTSVSSYSLAGVIIFILFLPLDILYWPVKVVIKKLLNI